MKAVGSIVVLFVCGFLYANRRKVKPEDPHSVYASDSELVAELKKRGIAVDPLSRTKVVPPEGLDKSTCAAYSALHYYRFHSLPATVDLSLFVPQHAEISRKGHPYLNTLATMRVPELTRRLIHAMADHVRVFEPTIIIAFETRAMAFGTVLAYHCGCAFVPARKQTDTVGAEVLQDTIDDSTSYRDSWSIAIDGEPFVKGDRVVIVDDVVSSGATIGALKRLLYKTRGIMVVGHVALVDFLDPSNSVIRF